MQTGACLKTLQEHDSSIDSVSWSPDGTMLASGSCDRTIKIWDVQTGICLKTLQGHDGSVDSVSWSSDGTMLASGSQDKTIKIWDVQTETCLKTLQGHEDLIFSVSWSPDGKKLASGSWDKSIKIWRISWIDLLKKLSLEQLLFLQKASEAWQQEKAHTIDNDDDYEMYESMLQEFKDQKELFKLEEVNFGQRNSNVDSHEPVSQELKEQEITGAELTANVEQSDITETMKRWLPVALPVGAVAAVTLYSWLKK